jgi:cystathionine beta-lyase/cystathionine gamma-synthase
MSVRPSNRSATRTTTPSSSNPDTIAVFGRKSHERRTGPLVPGIVQSTTYTQDRVGEYAGPTYSRVANPSVDELEAVLGDLEDAPPSVAFATGLAAETALFLAILKAGDHAIVGEALYGGTVRLFRTLLADLGIACTFVDTTNPAAIREAIRPNTKLIFVETPSNPTLLLTDLEAVATIANEAGVILAVDNTFLTPVLQRPLDFGAHVSVYSTTKHIEGHSTALGGVVTTRDQTLLDRLRFVRKCTGNIIAPFNAWLTTRGIKTLPLRLREHSRNALTIAQWLEQHPGVERVYYPGLASFEQADLARRQHIGGYHGGVVAFELVGGIDAGRILMNSVNLCRLVEHIGSVETLITHSASMTHADVPPELRKRVGITDGLVRLSVGLESPEDIINDLDAAISAATQHASAAPTTAVAISGGVE